MQRPPQRRIEPLSEFAILVEEDLAALEAGVQAASLACAQLLQWLGEEEGTAVEDIFSCLLNFSKALRTTVAEVAEKKLKKKKKKAAKTPSTKKGGLSKSEGAALDEAGSSYHPLVQLPLSRRINNSHMSSAKCCVQ